MANFAISNPTSQQVMTSAYKTLLSALSSATTKRIKIYDLLVGTNGTPADNFLEWDVSRCSLAGTGSALTPSPLDVADAAATTACLQNLTAEGTVGVQVFYVGVNQRASYRWVAAPGSELVGPATAANGFVLRAKSAGYTGTSTATMFFQEQ